MEITNEKIRIFLNAKTKGEIKIQKYIFNYIQRFLLFHFKNEDIVAEALAKIINTYQINTNITDKEEVKIHFKKYCYNITRNLLIDNKRKEKDIIEFNEENEYKKIEEELEDIRKAKLKKAIQKFLDEEKNVTYVIELQLYLNGYKEVEIAKELNIKYSTVKAHFFRIKNKLKKLL